MRKVAVIVVAALVVSLLAAFVFRPRGGDPRIEGGVVEMDQPIPDLTAIDTVSGDPLPPDAFEGSATVINVWANWCAPCRQEQPALVATQARYADQDVRFVGINYNDDLELARRWVDDFEVTYPSLYDPQGRTAALLDFPFLPDTYVVDGAGTIRYAIYGETDEDELSGLIDDVLAGDTASSGT
ncbi:MAG TPA: TlpA disulfide reductase family protein [Actinomycetota bacterium]